MVALGAKIDVVGGKVEVVGTDVKEGLQQGRALASNVSQLRREIFEEARALPRVLPVLLRRDWAKAFGPDADELDVLDFMSSSYTFLKDSWADILARLRERSDAEVLKGSELVPELMGIECSSRGSSQGERCIIIFRGRE